MLVSLMQWMMDDGQGLSLQQLLCFECLGDSIMSSRQETLYVWSQYKCALWLFRGQKSLGSTQEEGQWGLLR